MNKVILSTVLVSTFFIGGLLAVITYTQRPVNVVMGYKDAMYRIDGESIKLENGIAEKDIVPGTASKSITKYFGNDLRIDLNDDGREDVVFILTQQTGGSGVFFYVVAALNTEDGYIGSEALLLGDRIAPQSINQSQDPRHDNVIVVNYMERAPGESFVAMPSVGKSVLLKFDDRNLQFGVVERNFEGEADPPRMSLMMKKWIWISARYGDGRSITPMKPGQFTLSFKDNGQFSPTTDCNSVGGKYVVEGSSLLFDQIIMTKKACLESQENEFLQILRDTRSYYFTSRGELVLGLINGGTVIFR